jgi:hypothetical protein
MKAQRLTDETRNKPQPPTLNPTPSVEPAMPNPAQRLAQQHGWFLNAMKPGDAWRLADHVKDTPLYKLVVAELKAERWPQFRAEVRRVKGTRGPGPLHIVRIPWRDPAPAKPEQLTPEQRRAREQRVQPIDDRPFPANPNSYEFVCEGCDVRQSMSLLAQDTPRSGMRCVACGPIESPKAPPVAHVPAVAASGRETAPLPQTSPLAALEAFRAALQPGQAFFARGKTSGLPQRFEWCSPSAGRFDLSEVYPDAASCAAAILYAEASELQDTIDDGNQARRRLDELMVIALAGGGE